MFQFRNYEQFILRQMITFREIIFILSVVASWMTFAVLNRPPGTPADGYSDFIWWATLGWSIASSVFVLVVLGKYVFP